MVDLAKEYLIIELAEKRKIPIYIAEDIVDEVQYKVTEYLAGTSEYDSIESILKDYLGLEKDFSWVFLKQ